MKKMMNFFLLSCRKATELIEKSSVSRLNIKEKIGLKIHKSICEACSLYEKQSRVLDKLLEDKHSAPPLQNNALKEKIISSLPDQH